MGLRIPMARAEKLKIEEGSVTLGQLPARRDVYLKDDGGFAGKEVERETLNTIIHMRMRETFELLKRRLEPDTEFHLLGSGIFITGGTSQLQGHRPPRAGDFRDAGAYDPCADHVRADLRL